VGEPEKRITYFGAKKTGGGGRKRKQDVREGEPIAASGATGVPFIRKRKRGGKTF